MRQLHRAVSKARFLLLDPTPFTFLHRVDSLAVNLLPVHVDPHTEKTLGKPKLRHTIFNELSSLAILIKLFFILPKFHLCVILFFILKKNTSYSLIASNIYSVYIDHINLPLPPSNSP